jgi:hypothetical protein
LVGECVLVVSVIDVNAIYRTDFYTTLIDAVTAEPRDYPGHFLTPRRSRVCEQPR